MTQYHGTTEHFRPGDLIRPGRSTISGRAKDSGKYVHSTPFLESAEAFAKFKGGTRIYEVKHTGPTEPDPNSLSVGKDDADYGAIRSRRPMRVIREVGRKKSTGYYWLGKDEQESKGGGYNWKGPAFK